MSIRKNIGANDSDTNGNGWRLQEMRAWIQRQDYEALLRWWRFAPSGDPFFQEDTGDHYARVMAERRQQEPDGGAGASRRVGWDADAGERGRPQRDS